MKRKLGGIVVIDGTDHEFLWSDEHAHQESPIDMPVEMGAGPVAVRVPHLKFGGEIRIEVMLTAEARTDGDVIVSGACKLYEGASENTTNLKDEKRVALKIPKGGSPVIERVPLGKPKSDRADILLCLVNALAE
ncbi:MAG: hypothetical protein U0746_22855 [Gemmataceae bacterium]